MKVRLEICERWLVLALPVIFAFVCLENVGNVSLLTAILLFVDVKKIFLHAVMFLISSPTPLLIFSCISRHQRVHLQLASEGLWSGKSIYLHRGF